MGKFIGIYGGSFDPIHNGHINLAIEMMEARHVDEVWFCPSSINPNKKQGSTASVDQRVTMLNEVIGENPRFHLLDIEIKRKGISYTIDTLREIVANPKNHGHQFAFIMGEDAARSFYLWKMPDEIIKYAQLLIGKREAASRKEDFLGSPQVIHAIKDGLTSTRIMDISSTDVRNRIKEGLYCRHLLPAKVLDYIIANHLYLT